MPQEAGNGSRIRGATTDKKTAENKKHRDRKEPSRVPSIGQGPQGVYPKPAQGNGVRKNHGNRKAKPEEPEGIIVWIERLNEMWPFLGHEKIG